MKKEILFRVNAGGEFGSGHLTRCLVLARLLKKDYDPYFLVKGDNNIGEILYRENFNFKLAMHGFDEEVDDIRGLRPNLIVLDMRSTPIDFVRKIREYAPVLDIDDSGDGAEAADFVVKSLPSLDGRLANVDSPSLLIFDPKIDEVEKTSYAPKIKKVLVSFGGSDPKDLSNVMIRVSKLCHAPIEWSFVRGMFNDKRWSDGSYKQIKASGDIFAQIAEADLVVTSFGMTAYEAMAIGTPVVLLNPTTYHQQLTEKAGFFSELGEYSMSDDGDNAPEIAERFSALLGEASFLAEKALSAKTTVDKNGASRMLDLILGLLEKGDKRPCVVCGKRQESVLYRDEKRNIFRCNNCRLIYQRYFESPKFSYDKNYFTVDYEQQYGKTYLEDRPNIDKLNKVRLDVINKIYDKMKKKHAFSAQNMLEVGSAFGFFLDQARDRGWEVAGIEVSKEAVKYSVDKLGLAVEKGAFTEVEVEKERFQAISLWYVIEHLPRLNDVMEKVFVSLVRGGVLAISTPNCRGFLGRYREKKYIETHPADHFFDFAIPTMEELLKRYRFKIVKTRVTGIHYERFLEGRESSKLWNNGFVRWVYEKIAKLLKLGDTFEIYAVKK